MIGGALFKCMARSLHCKPESSKGYTKRERIHLEMGFTVDNRPHVSPSLLHSYTSFQIIG